MVLAYWLRSICARTRSPRDPLGPRRSWVRKSSSRRPIHRRTPLGLAAALERLEPRQLLSAVTPLVAVGQGSGAGEVLVYDAETGTLRFSVDPSPGANGAACVALGDVTGDGTDDLVVSVGGSSSLVKVYDGTNGAFVRQFDSGFAGGGTVAVGDVALDGANEILVSAAGQFKVFTGTGSLLASFTPVPSYSGPMRLAVGNVDGTGKAEILLAISGASGPQVLVIDTATSSLRTMWTALSGTGTVNASVAARDVDGDGKDEVILGSDAGPVARIQVWDVEGTSSSLKTTLTPYGGSSVAGARVGAVDVDRDGDEDVLAAPMSGSTEDVRAFGISGGTATQILNFAAFPTYTGNVFVAGGVAPGANTAPVAAVDSYSLNEDVPLVVPTATGVLANDDDEDDDPLTAVLVSGPAHGTLALNPDGSFTYAPHVNDHGTDSFTYRAYDGTAYSALATVTLTVSAVNDAPVLTGDASLPSVAEDATNPPGTAISSLFAGRFSDPDVGAALAGVAVVANTAVAGTHGNWQYSTDGSNWSDIVAISDGTSLVLSAGTLVRFVPAASYHGTPPALIIRALDNTYAGGFSSSSAGGPVYLNTSVNGGSTPISAGTRMISVTVTPINDPPVLLGDLELMVAEGGTVTVGTVDLSASDPEQGPSALIFTITQAPTRGRFELSTAPGQAVTHFTLADIQSGWVQYVHDGSETTSDTFAVRVSDGVATDGPETGAIIVTPVDDEPTFGASSYTFSVEEGPADGRTVGTVSASDAENEMLTFSIDESVPFAIDSNGHITVVGPLDYETEPQHVFTVRATEQAGSGPANTSSVQVTVNVTDVEPEPTGDEPGPDVIPTDHPSRFIGHAYLTPDLARYFSGLHALTHAAANDGNLTEFVGNAWGTYSVSVDDLTVTDTRTYVAADGSQATLDVSLTFSYDVVASVPGDGTWSYYEHLTAAFTYTTTYLYATGAAGVLTQWGNFLFTYNGSGSTSGRGYIADIDRTTNFTHISAAAPETTSSGWATGDGWREFDAYTLSNTAGHDTYHSGEQTTVTIGAGETTVVRKIDGSGGGLWHEERNGKWERWAKSGSYVGGDGTSDYESDTYGSATDRSYTFGFDYDLTTITPAGSTASMTGTRVDMGDGTGAYARSGTAKYDFRSKEHTAASGGQPAEDVTRTDQGQYGYERGDTYQFNFTRTTTLVAGGSSTLADEYGSGTSHSETKNAGGTEIFEAKVGDVDDEQAWNGFRDYAKTEYQWLDLNNEWYDYDDLLTTVYDSAGLALSRTGTTYQHDKATGSSKEWGTRTWDEESRTQDGTQFNWTHEDATENYNTRPTDGVAYFSDSKFTTTYSLAGTTVQRIEEGNRTENTHSDSTTDTAVYARVGLPETDGWSHQEDEIRHATANRQFTSEYETNLTEAFDSTGALTSRSGSDYESSKAWGDRRAWGNGSWTYQSTRPIDGGTESTTDSGAFSFDDVESYYEDNASSLTTYNTDGSLAVHETASGNAHSIFDYSHDGESTYEFIKGNLLAGAGLTYSTDDFYHATSHRDVTSKYDDDVMTTVTAASAETKTGQEFSDRIEFGDSKNWGDGTWSFEEKAAVPYGALHVTDSGQHKLNPLSENVKTWSSSTTTTTDYLADGTVKSVHDDIVYGDDKSRRERSGSYSRTVASGDVTQGDGHDSKETEAYSGHETRSAAYHTDDTVVDSYAVDGKKTTTATLYEYSDEKTASHWQQNGTWHLHNASGGPGQAWTKYDGNYSVTADDDHKLFRETTTNWNADGTDVETTDQDGSGGRHRTSESDGTYQRSIPNGTGPPSTVVGHFDDEANDHATYVWDDKITTTYQPNGDLHRVGSGNDHASYWGGGTFSYDLETKSPLETLKIEDSGLRSYSGEDHHHFVIDIADSDDGAGGRTIVAKNKGNGDGESHYSVSGTFKQDWASHPEFDGRPYQSATEMYLNSADETYTYGFDDALTTSEDSAGTRTTTGRLHEWGEITGAIVDGVQNDASTRDHNSGTSTGGWENWNADKSAHHKHEETTSSHDNTDNSYRLDYDRDTILAADGSSTTHLIRNGDGRTNVDRRTDTTVIDDYDWDNAANDTGQSSYTKHHTWESYLDDRSYEYSEDLIYNVDEHGVETVVGTLHREGTALDSRGWGYDGTKEYGQKTVTSSSDGDWNYDYDYEGSEAWSLDDSFEIDTTLNADGSSTTSETYYSDGTLESDRTFSVDIVSYDFGPGSQSTSNWHEENAIGRTFTGDYDRERTSLTSANGVSNSHGSLRFEGDSLGSVDYKGGFFNTYAGGGWDYTEDWDYEGGGDFNYGHRDSWELRSDGTATHDVSARQDGNHTWDTSYLWIGHGYFEDGDQEITDAAEHLDFTYDTFSGTQWDYLADGSSNATDSYSHTSSGNGNWDESYTYTHPDPAYDVSYVGHDEFAFSRTDNSPNGIDGVTNAVSGSVTSTYPGSNYTWNGVTTYPGYAVLNSDRSVRQDGPGNGHPLTSHGGGGNAPLEGLIYFDLGIFEYTTTYDDVDWIVLNAAFTNNYDFSSFQDFAAVADLVTTGSNLRDGSSVGLLSTGRGLDIQQQNVFFNHQRERTEGLNRFAELNDTFLHTGRADSAFGRFPGIPSAWGPVSVIGFQPNYDIDSPPAPYQPSNETSLIDDYVAVLGDAFDSGQVYDKAWAANDGGPAPTPNGLPDLQNLARATTTVSALTAFEAIVAKTDPEVRTDDLDRTLDAVFIDFGGRDFAEDLEGVYRAVETIHDEQSRDLVVDEVANLIAAGDVSDELDEWLAEQEAKPFDLDPPPITDPSSPPPSPPPAGGGEPTFDDRLALLGRKLFEKYHQYDEAGEQFDAAGELAWGFLVGFKDGFVGTVEGGASLVKGAWTAVKYVGTLPYRVGDAFWANVFGNGSDNFKREFADEIDAAETAGAVAEQTFEIYKKLVETEADIIRRILDGDFDVFYDVSETLGIVFEASRELFVELAIELVDEFDPDELGKVIGQVAYAITEAYLTAGLGTAAKTGKVAKLADNGIGLLKAKKLPGFDNSRVLKAFDKVSELLWRIATTEMCFVAGTQVHTPGGLKNIEDVQSGDLVLSRSDQDDQTGEVVPRRVLETFVTHPERLCRLQLKSPRGEEELVCTPGHRFYVPALRMFLPAGDLAVGSKVALAAGEAVLLAKEALRAEDGDGFTTFNFAVEDCRTYFVGDAGVWVHNTGAVCGRLAGHYWRDIGNGLSHAEATDRVLLKLDKLKISDAEKNKHLGDVFHSLFNSKDVNGKPLDIDVLESQVAQERIWDIREDWKYGTRNKGTLRGKIIEEHLARTEYEDAGWFNIGGKAGNPNNPLIDFRKGNQYLSLKTVDTQTSGWYSRMKTHIEELEDALETKRYGADAELSLDIRVQPGGREAALAKLQPLIDEYLEKGIVITIKEFP